MQLILSVIVLLFNLALVSCQSSPCDVLKYPSNVTGNVVHFGTGQSAAAVILPKKSFQANLTIAPAPQLFNFFPSTGGFQKKNSSIPLGTNQTYTLSWIDSCSMMSQSIPVRVTVGSDNVIYSSIGAPLLALSQLNNDLSPNKVGSALLMISPPLPDSLYFNTFTGRISGKGSITGSTSYTVSWIDATFDEPRQVVLVIMTNCDVLSFYPNQYAVGSYNVIQPNIWTGLPNTTFTLDPPSNITITPNATILGIFDSDNGVNKIRWNDVGILSPSPPPSPFPPSTVHLSSYILVIFWLRLSGVSLASTSRWSNLSMQLSTMPM